MKISLFFAFLGGIMKKLTIMFCFFVFWILLMQTTVKGVDRPSIITHPKQEKITRVDSVLEQETISIVAPPAPTYPVDRTIHLALTRVCISEAGFQTITNDCTLMYHALRNRSSTGEVTLGILRAYSTKTFNKNRTDSRRWIAHLNHAARRPEGWQENISVPWSSRRQGYIEVYNHVYNLLHTRPESPCNIPIDHWGARGFRRRRLLNLGWTIVQCGETLNDFWSLPRN